MSPDKAEKELEKKKRLYASMGLLVPLPKDGVTIAVGEIRSDQMPDDIRSGARSGLIRFQIRSDQMPKDGVAIARGFSDLIVSDLI